MSAETPSKANPLGPFQSLWYRSALLFFVVYLAAFWFIIGPNNPGYALMVTWATCALGPAIPASVIRRVPRRWLRVPAGERVLHRILGVGIFGWLLDASGWNRRVPEPIRGFSGKKAGLRSLEQWVLAGSVTHGICFAIHVVLAILALFRKQPFGKLQWHGALWMLLPGVVVHLYPVLLQRSMLLRLQPLLDKTASDLRSARLIDPMHKPS